MKRKAFAALTLAAALLLGACSGSGLAKMDFAGLQNEDGAYILPDVAWGASVAETEKALGVKLGEPTISQEWRSLYSIAGAVKWEGCTGTAQYEFFNEEGFTALEYLFSSKNENNKDKDLGALFDSVYEKVAAQYGEPSGVSETSVGPQYYWESESGGKRTAIYVVKQEIEGAVSAVRFIVTRPESPPV